MPDDRRLHPNLVDALDGTEADTAELEEVSLLLADLPPLQAPPVDLFERISAAAFAEPPAGSAEATTGPAPATSDREADEPRSTAGRRVVPLPRRRWPVLAAVAAAIVAAVGVGAALLLGDDSPEVREQVVALEALPGFEGVDGVATVIHSDGDRRVEVDLAEVDLPPGSHLELWLLDPAVEQIISLGVVTPGGAFDVPADVDLSVTPILDISVEPDDGDPAHSGVSVVRGEIEPA